MILAMGNNIGYLSKDTIQLWDSYNLLPSYPKSREECETRIRRRVNKAFKQAQSNFFHREGCCTKERLKAEEDVSETTATTPRRSKRLKGNNGENDENVHIIPVLSPIPNSSSS